MGRKLGCFYFKNTASLLSFAWRKWDFFKLKLNSFQPKNKEANFLLIKKLRQWARPDWAKIKSVTIKWVLMLINLLKEDFFCISSLLLFILWEKKSLLKKSYKLECFWSPRRCFRFADQISLVYILTKPRVK